MMKGQITFLRRPDSAIMHALAQHRKWNQALLTAPPASAAVGFPLKGCVVGCLVGDSLPNKVGALPWNSGSWSGKCFNFWDDATGEHVCRKS
jgi:hypothetical protein